MSKTNDATEERRDWSWKSDGRLDGMYVETRIVRVKNGPSAGKAKAVLDFHVGTDDELVTAWPTTVVRNHLRRELKARGKPDFERGERIVITPIGERVGARGPYLDFAETVFEFAAPKPSALAMLGVDDTDEETEPDDTTVRDEGGDEV